MGTSVPKITTKPLRIIDDSLTKDQRLMKLLDSYFPIATSDDQYPEKLTWCLEHCQNKFRDIKMSEGRVWYFQNDKDASMFALRWSDA
jgi:hypothetical protein